MPRRPEGVGVSVVAISVPFHGKAQRLPDDLVERASATDLGLVAARYGLTLKPRDRGQPCPHCGGRDRLAVNIRKGLWLCRHCQIGGGDAISFLRFLDPALGFREAVELLLGGNFGGSLPAPKPPPEDRPRDGSRFWLRLWQAARSPDGSPVERYLERRALWSPSADVVRFHPHCPFGKDGDGRTNFTPAMIALVRGIMSDEPQAIVRTAITSDGRKASFVIDGEPTSRMSLGPTKGGAIKVFSHPTLSALLGVGEGLETAMSLSLLRDWPLRSVWALINDGGVRTLPVLPGVERLMIAVDHDPPGIRAATAVAMRWHEAGRKVGLIEPVRPGVDLNDCVRGATDD